MGNVSNNTLKHYGTPRHSGRYPYGSGENPYQHGGDFLARIKFLQKNGKSEKEIAEDFGITTQKLRIQKSLARNEIRDNEFVQIKHLKDKGWSNQAIANKIGYLNESSVRNIINQHENQKLTRAQKTADYLQEQVDKKGMIDVGKGVENHLGVSEVMKDKALYILEMKGYNVYNGGVHQVTNPNQQTKMKVLTTPDKKHKDIYNFEDVKTIDYDVKSRDNGKTFEKMKYPKSLDSKRLQINYAEDGGKLKDGIIELRRGTKDLTLGDSKYSQVRILVDGTHYLKGVALYSDDLPKGVDVRFNTNKSKGTPKEEVLKKIKKEDPNNPFGSLIDHQNYYIDKDGKEHQSLINVTRSEGDWENWKKSLPSQFLGKQPKSLTEKQVKISELKAKSDFEDIKNLNNNVIKKKLLKEYSDECDAAAVDLKLAAFPRQRTQVILPVTSLKDNEVYAPNFKNGEQVALVRFPHGGLFEIPICKVNNKNKEGKDVITPSAKDAIGINQNTASILSGADFDGDTVVVIPITNTTQIKNKPPLAGLKNFDPALEYPSREGMVKMTKENTQKEMGKISNLITDMTLKGATSEELERAVKHSMVVIDAEKHGYDYKLSEKDNGIKYLKKKYQIHEDDPSKYGGASTLLSKAKSPTRITKRVGSPRIDTKTGELIWKQKREVYTDKKGKEVERKTEITKMANAKDARELISDYNTAQEKIYANYANFMKSMGNEARKEYMRTEIPKVNKEARIKFSREIDSLNAKLNIAAKNKPLERRAQLIATSRVNSILKDNPEIKDDKEYVKKLKQQSLERARAEVGADSKGSKVVVTDKEWEAIQKGAISATKLNQIIYKMDSDELRKLATPKGNKLSLSPSKISGIKAMLANGYTNDEIAKRFGVSVSTVLKYAN